MITAARAGIATLLAAFGIAWSVPALADPCEVLFCGTICSSGDVRGRPGNG